MSTSPGNISLRVDIDFEIGLARGVPYLLDVLAQEDITATFFVTMGPDGFRYNTKRIKSKNYLQRLLSFNPVKIVSTFGISYLFRQFFGMSGKVGADHPTILRTILENGHELGVHGYDHFWWAENVWDAEEELLRKDMEQGVAAFQRITGNPPHVWAAPNWRCSQASLMLLEDFGFSYGADCRGYGPFRPKIDDWEAKIVQLPITLPCLHEIAQHLHTKDHQRIINHFLSRIQAGFNVWCIHGYYEGVLERALFRKCVQAIKTHQQTWPTLQELSTGLDQQAVPTGRLLKTHLPGGRGKVSFQGMEE